MPSRVAVIGFAGYVILAISWSFVIPLRGGVDELRHLRYVNIVATEHRLPTPAEKASAISHQPPLHYLLAAPAYWLGSLFGEQGIWRSQRLVSVIMGGLALYLAWLIMRRLFPDRPMVAGLVVIAMGWLPHYLLACAQVSNDATAIAASVLTLYIASMIITGKHDLKWSALCGLAAGAACLTRHNTLVMLPPLCAGLLLVPFLRQRTDLETESRATQAFRSLAAFTLPFLLTAGLWLSHYLTIWGRLDSDPPWPEIAWPVHTFLPKLMRAVEGLYRSAWVQVGWLPGPHSPLPLSPSSLWPRPNLETTVMAVSLPIALVGVIGTAICLVRWLRAPETRTRALAMAMLVGVAVLSFATLTQNAMYVNPGRFEGGRYLLPAVVGFATILVVGPLALPRRPRYLLWLALPALLVVMNAISIFEMYRYLIPTFAQ